MSATAKRSSSAGRGKHGEDVALRALSEKGMRLRTRNYRCRWGEIDLIMRDGEAVVFVEVRLRGRTDYGTGAHSITPRKIRRLVATAEHYLQRHPHLRRGSCRFDVVSITEVAGVAELEWIRDAFQA